MAGSQRRQPERKRCSRSSSNSARQSFAGTQQRSTTRRTKRRKVNGRRGEVEGRSRRRCERGDGQAVDDQGFKGQAHKASQVSGGRGGFDLQDRSLASARSFASAGAWRTGWQTTGVGRACVSPRGPWPNARDGTYDGNSRYTSTEYFVAPTDPRAAGNGQRATV